MTLKKSSISSSKMLKMKLNTKSGSQESIFIDGWKIFLQKYTCYEIFHKLLQNDKLRELTFFWFFYRKIQLKLIWSKKCPEAEKNIFLCLWLIFRNIFTIEDRNARKKSRSKNVEKNIFEISMKFSFQKYNFYFCTTTES